MFKLWVNDKVMGLPTTVNIFKDTEEQALNLFNEYYKSKYELLNIVRYKNNKSI